MSDEDVCGEQAVPQRCPVDVGFDNLVLRHTSGALPTTKQIASGDRRWKRTMHPERIAFT